MEREALQCYEIKPALIVENVTVCIYAPLCRYLDRRDICEGFNKIFFVNCPSTFLRY